MKVIKTTATENETSSSLDLFGSRKLPKDLKEEIADRVGTYLVEQTLADISAQKSPVKGESIPALNPNSKYRAFKKKEVGNTKANLELSGETLDELTFKTTEYGIDLGVYGDRAPIADGHNNFSGKSKLTKRRILPGEGQTYRNEYAKTVERIIADTIAENLDFKKSEFNDVNSTRALVEVITGKLGPMSRNEVSLFIYRNEDLLTLLKDLNLMEFIP